MLLHNIVSGEKDPASNLKLVYLKYANMSPDTHQSSEAKELIFLCSCGATS